VSRPLVVRTGVRLNADPSRVLARLFVPGHELVGDQESRATSVLGRILALPDDVVAATLAGVHAGYDCRHRDLTAIFAQHYSQIAHRIPAGPPLSEDRKELLGAFFTHQFSVEGAALFNPSAVPHPDQSGLAPGECRVLLSLRAVGEGHISSVEFRSGVIGPGPSFQLDDPGPHIESGVVSATSYDRTLFLAQLVEEGADAESTRFVLGHLPARFELHDLELVLSALVGQRVTRHGAAHTQELARHIADCSYQLDFAPESSLSERVMWPESPPERQGMEDVRLVRFVEPDGRIRYLATYTAFDGNRVVPQLFETADFRRFRISQVAGSTAKNKGMALFPRKVGGRYLALSRWDRENSSIATSEDGLFWSEGTTIHTPAQPWELIQTGNCGSPLETAAGWLVLTHGVGPMREYAIGALLLDLEDPTHVIGDLRSPLLVVAADERDGYVPNVVYSCGGLIHEDQLLLPYGASDASVRFAFVDVPLLLEQLTGAPPACTTRSNSAA